MRIRHRAAVIALVIALSLSLGTAGLAGAASGVPSASLSQETTDASDAGDANVEFAGCSAARISGDVDRAMVETSFYGAEGVGGNTLGFDSIDGSKRIEAPGDGVAGETLNSVTLYRDGEIVAEKTNPERDSCWEQIRPEEPTISFVGQERTGENTYEATYEYTNPNDEALFVNNEFDGEVSGEAPREFEPGTHQFAVEWSPVNATETLTWRAHLGTFGYDTVAASSSEPETTSASDGTTGAASAGAGATQSTQTMTRDESTSNESASDDGSSAAPTIEFTGCSAARISGEADRGMAETSFYAPEGVGGNTLGLDRISGTTTVEVPGDGIAGETLNSVTLYRDGEIVAEKTNPQRDSCWERIKPEKVDVSFVGAKPTGDGAYEMTYEYTNPNDEALSVNSEFDGEVSGEAPREFEPGTHQFAVEWSPDGDERLTWNVHLGTFGYNTVRVGGSVPTETTDGDDSDGDDRARTDGGTDANDAGSNDDSSDEKSDAGSTGSSSNAGDADASANDDTTTTTDGAAQGSSGADDSNADDGDTPTPTTTEATTTTTDATDSAMTGGTDGVETEITGGVESPGQPGMGATAALLALVASTLIALRRR